MRPPSLQSFPMKMLQLSEHHRCVKDWLTTISEVQVLLNPEGAAAGFQLSLTCFSHEIALNQDRKPGRHSHKHKNMGARPLSVCLTFCSSLNPWFHRWPFSSLYSRVIHLSPRHGEGRISSGCPRDMGPGWCSPVLPGHTGLDLPSKWNSWAGGSHPAAGEAVEEQGTMSTPELEHLINIGNYC